jgi:predicted TIM-barrel fold metal-dependent hydrolase
VRGEVVDAHVHLLPPRLAARVRWVFDTYLPGQLAYPTPDPVAVLADLASAGAGCAWVLPYAHRPGVASWLLPATADHVAELAEGDHGVELVLGATVHPGDDDPAAIVTDAVTRLGARVLKMHCSVGGFRADDPRLDPVWSVCSELALPAVVHAGKHPAGISDGPDLEEIEAVATSHPELRLIVAHAAHPAVDATLALLDRHANVYADLTPVVAEVPKLTDEHLERYVDRLLFGSDAPNTGVRIPELVAGWRGRELPDAVTSAILGGNARRLLAAVRA